MTIHHAENNTQCSPPYPSTLQKKQINHNTDKTIFHVAMDGAPWMLIMGPLRLTLAITFLSFLFLPFFRNSRAGWMRQSFPIELLCQCRLIDVMCV